MSAALIIGERHGTTEAKCRCAMPTGNGGLSSYCGRNRILPFWRNFADRIMRMTCVGSVAVGNSATTVASGGGADGIDMLPVAICSTMARSSASASPAAISICEALPRTNRAISVLSK